MNLKEFGDKLIDEELSQIVEEKPYLSFVLMSVFIEFMGKCMQKQDDFHQNGDFFKQAIWNLESFSQYKDTSGINADSLYHKMRCGFLHAFLPEEGLKFSSDRNDLPHNVIGAKELYESIRSAWEELKRKEDIMTWMEGHKALIIEGRGLDGVSGGTENSDSRKR